MDENNPSGLPPQSPETSPTQGETSPTQEQGSAEPTRVKKFPVMEVFGPTIQGEGIQAGQRTGFIRFGGCDYRCQKCDSLHAVLPDLISKHAQRLTADEIANKCFETFPPSNCPWVTFSGGNPAMHDLTDVVKHLKGYGYKINVETQGTLCPQWLNFCDQITVSPKTPGMGEKFEEGKFQRFIDTVTPPICVKVVIFSSLDLEIAEWINKILDQTFGSDEHSYEVTRYLSLGNPYPPSFNEDGLVTPTQTFTDNEMIGSLMQDYRVLIEELLQRPNLKHWRFLPQIHVLAYGNQAGV